jgi:hypothetical protein
MGRTRQVMRPGGPGTTGDQVQLAAEPDLPRDQQLTVPAAGGRHVAGAGRRRAGLAGRRGPDRIIAGLASAWVLLIEILR